MSSPGDDDPPAGSPAPPTPPTEDSVVVDPALIAEQTPPAMAYPAPGDSDAILPPTYSDDALREAVGAPEQPRRKRSKVRAEQPELGDDGKKRNWTLLVAMGAVVVGGGIAALVLFGRVNAQRYFVNCTTKQAVAEQGRSFPPWGSRPLDGVEWRPIALPANAHCKTEELDSRDRLEATFLDMLLERTSDELTSRNLVEAIGGDGRAGPLDAISAQLEQALLLSRAPERGDQRKQVERMLGDVQYWRASLRLRDATAALADASKQFDAAALQRPLHVTDAGAWAEFLRRLSDELQAGPGGVAAPIPSAPTGDPRTAAPQGTALPVEPPPPEAASDTPPAPPDAGVPTGGVLL